VFGVRSSPFLSWLTSSANKALLPRPMWLMSSYPRAQVYFKQFTITRPRWTLPPFLLVFSLLVLEFMLFSLFPDYFCFRLARYVWVACPDQYTQFRPVTVRRSCGCFLWVFFIWSLTFRVVRVILVRFPAHFLFGLAWLLPFQVAQTQCSLQTLCCSTGSLLEFCRPFLFATSCSAFTW